MTFSLGDASLQVAREMLASLVLPAHSTIHDNACGLGAVTQAIIETQSPSARLYVYATDLGPSMRDATATMAFTAGSEWASQVVTQAMPSENLRFEDNMFTHSFMNFLIPGVSDVHKVLCEMRRTLKPMDGRGCGVGYVTTWATLPHAEAILTAHRAIRGAGREHPLELSVEWQDPDVLRKALERAGLEASRMSTSDAAVAIQSTKQWAHSAWGFLGQPLGRWVREDQRTFDRAVEIVQQTLEASESFKGDGMGGGLLTMRANVVTVRKKNG